MFQIARSLGISPHWIYDRIHNGTIDVALDPERRLYLFPDQPKTITLFKQLRAGKLQKLRFQEEYQVRYPKTCSTTTPTASASVQPVSFSATGLR